MFAFLHNNPDVVLEFSGNEKLQEEIQDFAPKDLPCFHRNGTITGTVTVTPPAGKIVSHRAINLILFGEYRNEKKQPLTRFFQRTQCLAPPGDLTHELKYDFKFENMNLPTNTYYGTKINAIFGIELRVVHRISDFVHEKQFIALSYDSYPLKTTIHNEVGIRNILHVEFIFPKQAYDAREAVVGAAYFILVKLRIVHMKMNIYRVESYESDTSAFKESTILKSYEILDGAPVRGDHIPIRIFLDDSNIWPYHSFVGSELKVDHYLRVEMVDENGKKYFKRMKIYFSRFKPQQKEKKTTSR
ncbi:Vacuolar protein sorting-associated protein 26 [Tritrichomonas foetus]|uniref:Vacuolar protein sorting-associated protein 26 n=1 Tax=Tritrichomonas foetus TaxID=1144522 RepID=A0A1J4JIK5_9EUKA|nr:Vacuolar protein sorting-associated protein 26 [Tritrichomonas foetus]|eukprot:OHS97357.1 Vacuolar protein sorting-associated protein 26 [Tritrichomonas foetus]